MGRSMGRTIRSVAWLLVVALLASACSGLPSVWPFDNDDAAAEGMRWLSDGECAGLSLAREQAMPLEPVTIDGWPDPTPGDHGVVLARVMSGDGEPDDAPVITIPDWHDPVALPAPLHPSGDLQGGPVTIQIGQFDDEVADERWCDEVHHLEVAPLPAAGSEQGLAAQVHHLDELVEVILEEHGTDPHTLATRDRDEVPIDLVPVYVLAVLLHDQDGLVAVVDDLSTDELDLADRLIARVQHTGEEELPTELTMVPSDQGNGATSADEADDDDDAEALGGERAAPRTARSTSRATTTPAGWTSSANEASAVSAGVPTVPVPATPQGVSDGDECTSTDFAGLTTHLGRQISGDTMAGGNTGLAIEAAMVVGGLPVIGRVGLPTVLTAWATKFAAEYLQGMLPSMWESTVFEHDPGELWEDDVEGGYVDAITMRFSSQGWDPGPTLIELAVILASQVSSSVLNRHLRKPRAGDPGVTELWGELVYDSMANMESAYAEAELVAEVVSWIASEVIGELVDVSGVAADNLVFPPECWEARTERPDLDDSVRLHYLDAIERGTVDEHFLATELGTGTIEGSWELPIGSAILGVGLSQDVRDASASFGATGDVEVRSLAVTWDPSRRQVEPGDEVTLQLEVRHAHDGQVRITDSLGQVDEVVDAGGGHTVTYTVPADWDGTPIAIIATSLSDTGMRSSSHPNFRGEVARTAWLNDEDDGLYVEPTVSCIEEGQTVRFEATDTPLGGDPVEVTWSAEGGTISSDGTFTAPSQAGSATVTATSVQDPDRQVTIPLTVGICDTCRWELTIDGDLYEHDGVSASGSSMDLWDVDWETGAWGSLKLGTPDAGQEGGIILVNDPPTPSTATQRPMHVVQMPWLVRSVWEGVFVPAERPTRLHALLEESEAEIPGWQLQPAQARLDHSLVMDEGWKTWQFEEPRHPTLPMEGEVVGPVMVGRSATGTIDGRQRSMSEGLIGEPLYGSISLRVEGRFRPPFKDRPNRDFVFGEGVPEDGDGPSVGIRNFDVEADFAWCGGVSEEMYDRRSYDDPGFDPSSSPVPERPVFPGG